jgi:hypothetical protein
MHLYSRKIVQFIHEVKNAIIDILSREMRVEVENDYFYDREGKKPYPISVVVYNDRNMLGYFDPEFYEIGLHSHLMYGKKEQLFNIIRHELAHYFNYIKFGNSVQPHGLEFRECCQKMGWGEEVYLATTTFESDSHKGLQEDNDILRKVKKLMSLATSSNPHEAEQAMIKSQQLLLKQNLHIHQVEDTTEEQWVLKRLMKQKKKSVKMSAIAKILQTFFVSIVYNRIQDFVYLEVLGSTVNVEVADYVAAVLDYELDRLWEVTRAQNRQLKGVVAKNSFFDGIAKGYCQKIQILKQEYHSTVTQALMVIEGKLVEAQKLAYSRLKTSKSTRYYCPDSFLLGEKVGKGLTLNPALNSPSDNTINLIGCT